MADNTNVQPVTTVQQPSASNASTAAATNSQKTFTTAETSGGSGSSSVSSLEDLREKAPQVYNAMMVGIAQNICKAMEDGQQRLKEIMRKNRDNT